ncbi:unnamed protein product [Trichobilharzia szidati]|nr:unnamed protein product [Trichobilharzia szidati]
MNLSSGNFTNSLESSSSIPSSPELMNNGITSSTTGGNNLPMNSPCISHGSSMLNGDVIKASPNHHHHHHQHHPSQNHHSSHHQNQHTEESRSALSASSSTGSSSSMLPGGLSMNHLSNPLFFPFPPNFLLQESFNLIYHTCLNMFEKRLTEELEQFHQKYEVLMRECSETRFRLNKVESVLHLFEEKFHPANFPFFLSGYFNPASLKCQPLQRYQEQQHQQQQQQQLNEMNDTNLLNSLKSVESAWLYSWKEYESLSNSFNSAHSNASPNSLLTSMSATATTTSASQGDQQQHSQFDQRQKIHSLSSKQHKENNLEQFSINRLSNSETQSSTPPPPPPTTTTTNDATNLQLSTLNESFASRIHNSSCNLNPALLPSSNNRQFMWNQWMANFMAASSGCMNSTNGLLSASVPSSSSSSLTMPSTLNNSERINSFNASDIEVNEGNQHKSPRLYPPVFFSNYEFNPTDLLNINRKSTSSAASSSPSAPAPSSSSSSLRFRGSKFGRLKTKCLNSNRCQQVCPYPNNRLHLCHNNNKSNHHNAGISTSALKNMRRSAMNFNNCPWALSGSPPPPLPPRPLSSSTTDQGIRSSLLGVGDLQHSGSNGMLHSTASNSRSSQHNHHHHPHHNNSNNNNQNNNLIDRPVVILNPDEPREIFIGGVQSVSLPLWAYCKCLTMVRGEPHELGPRLCLRLLQSLFSLHYLVTHNYNGSGGKAPIDPIVMSAVLRQAQLQFGSGYFFTEPMALGKLRDYLNNAFRVMAFRQRKGERVRSPFWNDKGEPIHDLEAPVEFANITDIIVIPPHTNSSATATTTPTSVTMTTQTMTSSTTTTTTTALTNEIEMNRNSR